MNDKATEAKQKNAKKQPVAREFKEKSSTETITNEITSATAEQKKHQNIEQAQLDKSLAHESSATQMASPSVQNNDSTKTAAPAKNLPSRPSLSLDDPNTPTALVERIQQYDPECNSDLVLKAFEFGKYAHRHQKRKNGDPYFTHPLAVALILINLRADPEAIITALLHDTVEDTEATIEDIENEFGASIAALVDGVTKLTQYELKIEASKQAENFQKFVLAMAKDVRVLLVKLADRLHNMRTLHHITKKSKRERIALETMQIYAPLAGRIGVQAFREELEDLSFRHLNPEGFASIDKALAEVKENSLGSVIELSRILKESLKKAGLNAEIHSREKRPFSIWRKMQRKKQGFEELADIYAFRILVDTEEECYQALGIIHRAFKMIPHEFDDYISIPKPNNYQSIHTAVLAPLGKSGFRQKVEIQIRTKKMHETAERGIAAHWRYKAASTTSTAKVIEIQRPGQYDPYEWARHAVEMLSQGDSADEFLENAKLELFQDQVFCFTPKGRVIPLPTGATGIDFAYALHTEVGDSCVGVRINSVTRPLRTPLKNGDIVEVLRSLNAPIPNGWEGMVATGRAKAGIRKRIKELHQQEQIKLGQRIIEAELAAEGLELSRNAVRAALRKLNYKKVDEVYQAVGALKLSPGLVRETLFPGAEKLDHAPKGRGTHAAPRKGGPIPIIGLTRGVSVRLATCCSPLPGERIVGVPDVNGIIDVHRIDCQKLETVEDRVEEWLDLKWNDDSDTSFSAPIIITVTNRIGALAHVSNILSRYEGDITNIRLRNREVEFHDILVDVLVKNARHLNNILTALRASDIVLTADRIDLDQPRKAKKIDDIDH
ncbi:MAG: RelA/SpoT family protein [bacterium]